MKRPVRRWLWWYAIGVGLFHVVSCFVVLAIQTPYGELILCGPLVGLIAHRERLDKYPFDVSVECFDISWRDLVPEFSVSHKVLTISFPHIVLWALGLAICWMVISWRRRRTGLCVCGYPTDSTRGICPECGKPAVSRGRDAGADMSRGG